VIGTFSPSIVPAQAGNSPKRVCTPSIPPLPRTSALQRPAFLWHFTRCWNGYALDPCAREIFLRFCSMNASISREQMRRVREKFPVVSHGLHGLSMRVQDAPGFGSESRCLLRRASCDDVPSELQQGSSFVAWDCTRVWLKQAEHLFRLRLSSSPPALGYVSGR
jgi:hypothetical protein